MSPALTRAASRRIWQVLLRKYALSNNVALDGVRMQLNSSHLTAAGPVEDLLLDADSDDPSSVPLARAAARRSERVTKLKVRAPSLYGE